MNLNCGLSEQRKQGIIDLIRYNAATEIIGINKMWTTGNISVTFTWQSRKNLWGRFGGGWNWHVGIEWGRTTIILFLLICYITISKKETK